MTMAPERPLLNDVTVESITDDTIVKLLTSDVVTPRPVSFPRGTTAVVDHTGHGYYCDYDGQWACYDARGTLIGTTEKLTDKQLFPKGVTFSHVSPYSLRKSRNLHRNPLPCMEPHKWMRAHHEPPSNFQPLLGTWDTVR